MTRNVINQIKYCKEQVKKIETMEYDYKRASLFLLMKFCSYMGDILKNNKFMFNGLDLNIDSKEIYTFIKPEYYNLLEDVSEYLINKIF